MTETRECCEITHKERNDRFYVQLATKSGTILTSLGRTIPDNHAYVYRNMSSAEMEKTLNQQKLQTDLRNPSMGEKWFTEDLSHSRTFKNKGASGSVVTAEFKVEKGGYDAIKQGAIPQKNSKAFQSPDRLFNLTNTERLGNTPGKQNICMKGAKNVEKFNTHVIKVSEIDPMSFTNRSSLLTFIRRNPGRTALISLGIVVDGGTIVISIINDDGEFGKSTQITVGEVSGGLLGAEIGAALGSFLPGRPIFNIVFGIIGGILGSILGGKAAQKTRYLLNLDRIDE